MVPQIDFPTFRPRPPWLGGDLQTLRNFVLKAAGRGPRDLPGTRLFLPTRDGGDDRLAARLTRGREGRPLVVLIHGLTGCETSFNVIASAWHFHRLDYPVLRLNLRGAGPTISRVFCRVSIRS